MHHHKPWGYGYGSNCGQQQPQACPTQVMPTQTAPAQVSPTKQYVNTNVMNTVVPHIHPSHTTTVNKHIYTHQHSFPHTQSVVNECYEQHVVCGAPVNPCCPKPYKF